MRNTSVRQVVLDKWLPLKCATSFPQPSFVVALKINVGKDVSCSMWCCWCFGVVPIFSTFVTSLVDLIVMRDFGCLMKTLARVREVRRAGRQSYTILYYTILYYTILYYTILHYTIVLVRRVPPLRVRVAAGPPIGLHLR